MKKITLAILILAYSSISKADFESLERAEECTVATSAIYVFLGSLFDDGENIDFDQVELFKKSAEKYIKQYNKLYLASSLSQSDTPDKFVAKMTKKLSEASENIVQKRDTLAIRMASEYVNQDKKVFETLLERSDSCAQEFQLKS